MNKNINMPFLGIGIIVAVGLIWAAANFFNIKDGMVSRNRNIAPVEFDVAGFQADRQSLAEADTEASSLSQDDAVFAEIDRASDSISGASDLALDDKSLSEESQAADISGDIDALDDSAVQNEIDQSMNNVVQN